MNSRNLIGALGSALLIAWPGYAPAAKAQTARPITLKQAVRLALEQNPEVMLARLEEEKARRAVSAARAPYVPQLFAGSGLAYTDGIPQSVEGANPSIVQVVGRQYLYNRSQSKRVSLAKEEAVAAGYSAESKRQEMVFRVASDYLGFERAWRAVRLLEDRADQWRRVESATAARVEEGRAIPLELSRVRLEAARARQALSGARADLELLEAQMRHHLVLGGGTRLEPVPTDTGATLPIPESEALAREQAVEQSPELNKLSADLRAKELAIGVERGALYPRIDLVAKYSLLSRFNNFEDFFNKFQRNNTQVGMSFQLPIFAGRSVSSRVAKVKLEARETEIRQGAMRSSVDLEAKRLYHQVESARRAREVARMELDFARENLTVLLARLDEGRVSMDDVERARVQESLAWEGYYFQQYELAKAKLDLLRRTGGLMAALR